jgi:hypothetical protein
VHDGRVADLTQDFANGSRMISPPGSADMVLSYLETLADSDYDGQSRGSPESEDTLI